MTNINYIHFVKDKQKTVKKVSLSLSIHMLLENALPFRHAKKYFHFVEGAAEVKAEDSIGSENLQANLDKAHVYLEEEDGVDGVLKEGLKKAQEASHIKVRVTAWYTRAKMKSNPSTQPTPSCLLSSSIASGCGCWTQTWGWRLGQSWRRIMGPRLVSGQDQ